MRAPHASARQLLKRVLDICCAVLVAPCGLLCALEARRDVHHETVFSFWAQTFALIPGLPGVFVRRAFYRMTLAQCAESFHIGFGAFFSHRQTVVEDDVYVGPYAIVGSSRLRRGCLVGSRVGIVSGVAIHRLDANGHRTATDPSQYIQVEIGEHVWIGEACLVMANVGARTTVSAGSVVANPVPAGVVVGGNPARFIRHVEHPAVIRDFDATKRATV